MSGGVLQDISKTVRAIIISESAHHLDLRASNAKDPKSVIKARIFHKSWIKKWIAEYKQNVLQDTFELIIHQL